MKVLNLEGWPRRSHFEFFRRFENPYFNICGEVAVTRAVERCRCSRDGEGKISFNILATFAALTAANAIPEFRRRIRGEEVVEHEVIHGGTTVLMPDESFAFAYFDFTDDFDAFHTVARERVAEVLAGPSGLNPDGDRDDLIHFSVIPWISFTSFSHARRWAREDSVPKIVFGKHHPRGGEVYLPVSVELHHAVADGLHCGRFFQRFQEALG